MKATALPLFLAAASCGLCDGGCPPGTVLEFCYSGPTGSGCGGGGADGALCGRSCAGSVASERQPAEPFHYSHGKCIGDEDMILAAALAACKATPFPGCEDPACGKCAVLPENACKGRQ